MNLYTTDTHTYLNIHSKTLYQTFHSYYFVNGNSMLIKAMSTQWIIFAENGHLSQIHEQEKPKMGTGDTK